MRIEVSATPPRECSPNWRGHWRLRYLASKSYQEEVYCTAKYGLSWAGYLVHARLPIVKGRIHLTVVYGQNRTRDRDNIIAMFKPGLDALVLAGILQADDSDHLEYGDVTVEVDKARAPLTIITIEEAL